MKEAAYGQYSRGLTFILRTPIFHSTYSYLEWI